MVCLTNLAAVDTTNHDEISKTSSAEESRFFKLVSRETANEKSHKSGDKSKTESHSRGGSKNS